MLRIENSLLEQIAEQGRKELPNEACGYLAGVSPDSLDLRIPLTNIDASPEHFSLDPKEQFNALKEAREGGRKLLVVYHTHPETPARMSDEDIRLANDPRIHYLIYSLVEGEAKIFGINRDKEVREVEYETY